MSRDNIVIIPSLKADAGALKGPLNDVQLTGGARTYFTEWFDVGPYTDMVAFLRTSAHAGTNPTLDVNFQWSPDRAEGSWTDQGDSFSQVGTTDSTTTKKITATFGKYMRAKLVVGGTANPNYKVGLFIAAKA